MSGPHPPLTLHRRLGPGAVLRAGSQGSYLAVAALDGEPHLVRYDAVPAPAVGEPVPAAPRRALLVAAHVTDLQLADVQSPTRFEFLNREFTDPRFAAIVPVQRPQEALTAHAVNATVATVNRLPAGPASGAPLQIVVTTGDAIDNAQWNEMTAFLALFDGGLVRAGSGGPRYEGVQHLDWPDDIFWRPDGVPGSGPDIFRAWWGFGDHPGVIERALADFRADGLRVPWLACFGNHEALNQGVGVPNPALAAAMVGGRKPLRLPDGFDPNRALDLFTFTPEVFMSGPSRPVTPDPARRPVTRAEFVAAHFHPGAQPDGHGFTERNRADGTAYYVHDLPGVRLIGVDTTCLAGGADGCLDEDQAGWLQARLAEVHSAYLDRAGSLVRTGAQDRLVVVFSHHGVDTLSGRPHPGPGGSALLGGDDVVNLLLRFPNVVLWLNGHTHTNRVRPRLGADGRTGFWEVTTSAVVDWPCQTRLIEIVDGAQATGDGQLSIVCTLVDHDSPLAPAGDPRHYSGPDLAALHRELAGNVPWAGFHSLRAGQVLDRNVELRLPAPFPLSRLPTG